jgi:putative N6-adenine-specific DNA methylase
MFDLFIIVPPGLEELAKREMMLKCPPTGDIEVIKGGLICTGTKDWIFNAHHFLKLPVRILLRLDEFKVRDFPRLFQKLNSFKWNSVLGHPQPNWQITCSQSRLMHTGRIEEIAQKAVSEYLVGQPLSSDWKKRNYSPQTFYLRLENDILTLSLDLSGEALYKRGYQIIKGHAPLRENLASALLMQLFDGVHGPISLVDPMCGSGTFLFEALYFHHPNLERTFSFQTCPLFKGFHPTLPKAQQDHQFPVTEFNGFDINTDLLSKISPPKEISMKTYDTFKNALPFELTQKKYLMICNPPYGERIEIEGKRGHFLKESWLKFLKIDQPTRLGWLVPTDMDDLFLNPPGYKELKKLHFKNGGLAVTFWLWEKISSTH